MDKPVKKYDGVIVPMVTPINKDFTIDNTSVEIIMGNFNRENVHPFILGTTGESVSVSHSEKLKLVKAVLAKKGNSMKIFAGISGNCLRDSVNEAIKYAEMGVDAVVAHLPFYYPLSEDQILRYYGQLADEIPCNLILYNNPITVKQSVPVDIAEKLSYHPNIAGIKDSERGLERLNQSVKLWKYRPDFVFLVGWSARSAYSLLNGSDGIVPSTGNLMPKIYKDLYDSALKGESKIATEFQEKVDYISDIYMKDKNLSQSIPSLKFLMSLYGLCQPYVLPPLYQCGDEDKNRLAKMIKTVTGLPV